MSPARKVIEHNIGRHNTTLEDVLRNFLRDSRFKKKSGEQRWGCPVFWQKERRSP
jgi:hypothetical protein